MKDFLPEGIVDELWDEARHQGAVDFETGVRIYFNQIGAEVLINHEVVTKELAEGEFYGMTGLPRKSSVVGWGLFCGQLSGKCR